MPDHYKQPEQLSEMLQDLLSGLGALSQESRPLTEFPITTDVSTRLVWRQFGAALAHALFKYYSARNIEIPQEILEWQNICANPEEFAEIRNQWVFS